MEGVAHAQHLPGLYRAAMYAGTRLRGLMPADIGPWTRLPRHAETGRAQFARARPRASGRAMNDARSEPK